MRKAIIVTVINLFFFINSYSQYITYRIHPSDTNQIEPSIVRHPVNPQILFASAYTIKNSFRTEGVYVTTNGGQSWYGFDRCPGGSVTTHGGDPGPVIDKNGRFILTHQGNVTTGMYSNFSTDNGLTWSNTVQILSGDQDKGSPGTDDNPVSPYYGRTYLTWTRYTLPFPVVLSYTLNGAETWSAPIQVNNSISGHSSTGPSLVTGLNGEVYIAWASTLQTSPFIEDFIGFAKSNNGGLTWTAQEQAYDCNGIKSSQLAPWNIRVNSYPMIDIDKSGGSRNGWLYIITTEKNLSPAGTDPDIILHRSTNGGQSWSPGIRVNQDPLNNGEVQYFPALRVDEGGGINIVYYDTRNSPGDSVGVFYSRSTDGGNTWVDQRVNDHWFYPIAVSGSGGGNQGDNIGVTSGNWKLYPTWMDNHSGTYQIWSTTIAIPNEVKKINEEVPDKFLLKQNYPNPFNPNTSIRFSIPSDNSGMIKSISMIIYNSAGQKVETLIDKGLQPGEYEINWDAKENPSGIFFCQLIADNKIIDSKKMILIR